MVNVYVYQDAVGSTDSVQWANKLKTGLIARRRERESMKRTTLIWKMSQKTHTHLAIH